MGSLGSTGTSKSMLGGFAGAVEAADTARRVLQRKVIFRENNSTKHEERLISQKETINTVYLRASGIQGKITLFWMTSHLGKRN